MPVKQRQPITWVISLLLTMGFLVTTLASYLVSISSFRAEIDQTGLPLTSDTVYSEIQRDLLRPILISSMMASDTFLRDWLLAGEQSEAEVRRYLFEIRQDYDTFSSFLVSDRTGTYYTGDGILKTVSPDEPRDAWYYRVREMEPDYEINVDPDMANADAMTIFVNYRAYGYDGEYLGATGVGLTVDAVVSLIEAYQAKYGRHVYFCDAEGNVMLAGSGFPVEVTNVVESHGERYAQALASPTETFFRERQGRETVHTNIRYIPEFDWYLVVEQAEGETARLMLRTLLTNLAVCAAITVVVLLLVQRTVTAYRARIETLSGIIPICSYCKKIRDDAGYWNQLEAYISQHSDALFSHGICPECMVKYYPEMAAASHEPGSDS